MRAIIRFFINIIFCKIFYRVKFYGKENVRNLDKCLICPNHSNTVEPAWIYSNNKHLCIMAKAELFENKFLAKLYKHFGVFPIRRGEKDVKSILHAINLFKDIEKKKGGNTMTKLIAKIAEKYAKATNNACIIVGIIHQPKMPASLIKKD